MWIEEKYIALAGARLLLFRKRGRHYEFRCPTCGDSRKNPYKTRGTIYNRKGEWWVGCFNCGMALPFKRWLKEFDSGLYETMLAETFVAPRKKPAQPDPHFHVSMERLEAPEALAAFPTLETLDFNHPARRYIEKRLLPKKWLDEIRYIENFKEWVNTLIPEKFGHPEIDEPRILIPMLDGEDNLIGGQVRILGPGEGRLRYITFVLPGCPKLWGLNHVNLYEPFYVLEGPLDAMFLDNALATCGGKITSELLKVGPPELIENCIIVYDNEPRNTDVVKNVWKAVRGNYKVVIWPSAVHHKDINEMVLAGVQVEKTLALHTFQGFGAEIEFRRWNKTSWKP